MIDISHFIDLYRAKFGNFPADPKSEVQIGEWKRVLSQIPERRLDAVFANVSEQLGKSNKNPRTREFENALRALGVTVGGASGFKGEGCGMCGGCGILSIWVTYMEGSRRLIGFHKGGYPYSVGVPCKCSKGHYLKGTHYGEIRPEVQEKAFRWLVDQGEQATARGVSVGSFIAAQAKRASKMASFRRGGKDMAWLERLVGKKEVENVVRSSGERAKCSGPEEPGDDSGGVPVRNQDDPVPTPLPEGGGGDEA